jgi:hypothetical protein
MDKIQVVYYIQKRIIRMAGTKREVSCREILKKFNSSTSQQILALSIIIFSEQDGKISN